MNWDTPIRYVPFVGPAYAARLRKLEIETAGDLLYHFPFRYEDYSLVSQIGKVQPGERVTVIGKIAKAENIYTRSRKQIQRVTLTDETGQIDAIWFNQPYIVKGFNIGESLALGGIVKSFGPRLQLESPEYEDPRADKPLLHLGRLVPVYPETAGISSKWLRNRIFSLLASLTFPEILPQEIVKRHSFPLLSKALNGIHFPQRLADSAKARTRFAFEELFLLQLGALIRRKIWQRQIVTHPLTISKEKVSSFIGSLPFTLTFAQTRAVTQILTDLGKQQPMNRLLQGDVGSGKTVVAAIAMYMAYLNGFQSLFMAPTEILALQHLETLSKLLQPFNLNVGIRTGSRKLQVPIRQLTDQTNSKSKTANPNLDILVGTHALLEKNVQLKNVGLVVIDEQHRFGVRQRALLREKGTAPHVLTMTATPIPRTQVLTLYGDLDLSVIDEMPLGRKPVKTWVVPPEKRAAAYAWIRTQIKNSSLQNQAFIICPFIEPSETLTSVKAATEEFSRLKKDVFPDLHLGLLHGRMKAKEKNRVLDLFRKGDYSILVSTPVVEVGIDIPAATIILIETAERFGLAQLHQLRGRVGRGDVQAYCLLFLGIFNPTAYSRLKHLERAASGAELAELDLRLRGPGTIYGTAQHGREELKVASLTDTGLLETARFEAEKLLSSDQELTAYSALKERLKSGTIAGVSPD